MYNLNRFGCNYEGCFKKFKMRAKFLFPIVYCLFPKHTDITKKMYYTFTFLYYINKSRKTSFSN
ncbi:hypothetical protein HanRHA438_Chr12g0536301 [Helianthus annuus]|nr:hypothetical protein HanRHA438_Chr12g0536301 [Helianthus annuus]